MWMDLSLNSKFYFKEFFFLHFVLQPHFPMICLVNLEGGILQEVPNEVDHADREEAEELEVLDVQIQLLRDLEVSVF